MKSLDLLSVPDRLLRVDLIKYWKSFHCVGAEDVGLSSMFRAIDGQTRGHPCKVAFPYHFSDFSNFLTLGMCLCGTRYLLRLFSNLAEFEKELLLAVLE